ncbi:MAG: bifunctional oligoribonuclease/PAP phosphatase NrnA [bacterium]|nr:bifunctional oligoribonuclease/PAP phosphatase NrnA [bacterium]
MPDAHAEHFANLHKLMGEATRLIFATHENPDADAIGAVYGLAHVAAHMGKSASLFLPDGVPQELAFLSNDLPRHTDPENLEGDVLIAVDYGDFKRTKLDTYVERVPLHVATIDHHPLRDHRGKIIIVDTSASSTCEIIYRFCRETEVPLTKDLATCLLAGIIFDTGGLKHSSTSQKTMEVVTDLIRHGARMHKAHQVMRTSSELESMRIIARALARIVYDKELSMSYTVIPHEELRLAGEDADVSIVTHLLGTGEEHKFAVVFKESEPGKFRVSLRSENFKGVDVSKIASQFGGGGHMYASGCSIDGSIEEVLTKFREVAKATLS